MMGDRGHRVGGRFGAAPGLLLALSGCGGVQGEADEVPPGVLSDTEVSLDAIICGDASALIDPSLPAEALAGAGDMDGDGLGEIALGFPYGQVSGVDRPGVVYLISGLVNGRHLPGEVGITLSGLEGYDEVGYSLASAEHADGRGILVIGAPSAGDVAGGGGGAWVVAGPVAVDARLDEVGIGLLGSGAQGSDAGISVAAGDVDGDGVADVVVGERGLVSEDPGRVYLVLGPIDEDGSLDDADGIWEGISVGSSAGGAVAVTGDSDGDGLADLVVAASNEAVDGQEGGGAAYMVLGPATGEGSLAEAVGVVRGRGSNGVSCKDGQRLHAGSALADAGDANGDSLHDLIVGSWISDCSGEDAGRAALFLGPIEGARSFEDPDKAYDLSGAFGETIANVGDIDGDGIDELLFGVDYAENAVMMGAGLDGKAIFDCETSDDTRVAGLGDIDGDGRPDFAFGGYEIHVFGSSSSE